MPFSPSYLRNGLVGTRRGLSGDDGGNFGDESEEVSVQVGGYKYDVHSGRD